MVQPGRQTNSLPRIAAALATLLAVALLSAGCGDEGDDGDDGPILVEDRPGPPASDFPSPQGQTLGEMIDLADPPVPTDPVVTPGAEVFYSSDSEGGRYPLYVTDRDGVELVDATIALYAAPIPGGRRGQGSAFGQPARGPYPADLISLAVESRFRSDPPHPDHRFADSFFLATVPFTSGGEWRIVALVEHEDKLTSHMLPAALVDGYAGIPQPDTPAPPISTPTVEDVDGDRSKLSTRVPPSTQNEVDFMEVLGEKPVALLFASPEFCQSRVCGPAVDIAERAKHEHGGEVEFIQMEIYNDNDPAEGVRPQIRAYNLPSEPWLFVIDEDGIVRTAIEGAFGTDDLARAVMEVKD